jgi:ribosome-associated protein
MVKSRLHKQKKEKTLQKTENPTNITNSQSSISEKDQILASIDDAKGLDVKIIEVSHLTSITDHIIIVSGTSNRHLQTIAETAIKDAREKGTDIIGVEGLGQSEWVVVDFGDTVLHVMSPSAREFYNIEGLWDIQPEQE